MVQAILSYVVKAIDEASSVMDKVKASVGILGSTLGELGGGFASVGNIMTGFAGAGVVGAVSAGLGEVIKGLQTSVKDAAVSEQAFKDLSIAVEKSGTAWNTVEAATRETLLSLQKVTVYSDEQVAGALQKLLTFGMSYDEAMKALSGTIDLAAAKHLDLETAAGVVGKAFMGNTSILARYGIDITTSKEATAALKDAHDQLGGAIKNVGDNLGEIMGTWREISGVTDEFIQGFADAGDKAKYLTEAFKQGTIDADTFSQIMSTLGVNVDAAKLKTADFPAVMAQLNEQFGGTAQEQAKTYAGIQERFKNAVSELGEKVGGILLPALSGITEAMIPVADWFGKGVDAVQAWITEVGKMPEVKGFVDAVGEAFDGFLKYLQDVWKFIQDTFGPVLRDLWDAFKELWDALSPIGEALGEIFGAMSEGSGGVDILKLAIQAIAFEIKGFAELIKLVAPYIRQFAEAFKAAADFIAPILGQLKDAIGGFIDWLKDTFQGFYNWLIGASLWSDLWDAVISKTGAAIGQLLSDLAGKLFEPMKTTFTDAVGAVKRTWNEAWQAVHITFTTISDQIGAGIESFLDSAKGTVTTGIDNIKTDWETGWNAVQTTFNTVTDQIQSDLNTKFEAMKAFVSSNLGEYAPIANNALNAMQSAMNAVMFLIHGDWQGFLDNMNLAMTSFWSAIQGVTDTAFTFLQASFTGSMNAIRSILDGAVSAMQNAWSGFMGFMQQGIGTLQGALSTAESYVSSAVDAMQGAVSSALSYIQSAISSAWSQVTTSTKEMSDSMTKHSIWPDMLDEMKSQTEAALGNIVGDFEGAFGGIGLSVPSVAPTAAGRTSLTEPVSVSVAPQSITIPITVTLDGQPLVRVVKKVLIEQRQYHERSVGRLT